jgi:hypothetical protein
MAVVYDPRYQTWDAWASLMVEAYAAQQLEIPSDESKWQEWAAGFRGIDLFAKDAVPDPYTFGKWQDWATAVVNTVSASTT